MAPRAGGEEERVILDGKTVVVVGAGPGLGAEVARGAVRDGARVVLAARTPAKLEQLAAELDPAGERVACVPADVTDEAACEALAAATSERFGAVHGVVQVAALDAVFGSVRDGKLDDWRTTFETNTLGPVRLARAFAPRLAEAGGGSLVWIASQAMRVPTTDQPAYAASKGALHTAMFYMVRELGPDRIRVNLVVPTWMWGPPVEAYVSFKAQKEGRSSEEVVAEITARMPLGEIPADEDVAEAVLFLWSDRARMITGQTLYVNAGEFMQ